MNNRSIFPFSWGVFSLCLFILACNGQNSNYETGLTSNQNKSDLVISLAIGETAAIESHQPTLTLMAIAEDSRCPANMKCMQEGHVSADFKLSSQNKQKEESFRLTLKAAQPDLATKKIDGYIIKLIKVEPAYKVGTAIAGDQYKINLLIERE
jgi:hypothetical protein